MKSRVETIVRIICILATDYLLYHDGTVVQFVDFIFLMILALWMIPKLSGIFFDNTYDGEFLIDETDPTDVKFKLTMDTDVEKIIDKDDIYIRINHIVGEKISEENKD